MASLGRGAPALSHEWWLAAGAFQALQVAGNLWFAQEPDECLRKDFIQAIVLFSQTVMRPFAVAPGLDKAGPFQIREMAGNLRLVRFQDRL